VRFGRQPLFEAAARPYAREHALERVSRERRVTSRLEPVVGIEQIGQPIQGSLRHQQTNQIVG